MFTQKIKIQEYTSASILKPSTRQHPEKIISSPCRHVDLDVNFLKFSTAMVKANTTHISSVSSQAYDILLSGLSLFGLLNYKGSHIKLKNGFRKKYRDFSRSGRIGELAQAINYIFSQERLGYKYIIDFDTFLNENSIKPIITGGTPDYVLLGKPGNNLSILESKGSSKKNKLTTPELRAKLQSAMGSQCLPGVRHIQKYSRYNVSNSYASVIEFAESSEARESCIHFADPEYDNYDAQDYSVPIRKFYSRWLAFLGVELAVELYDRTFKFELPLNTFELIKIDGVDFYVQKSNYNHKYLSIPVRYGLSTEVIRLLEMGDYHAIFNLKGFHRSYDSMEIFSDGSVAIFENALLQSIQAESKLNNKIGINHRRMYD